MRALKALGKAVGAVTLIVVPATGLGLLTTYKPYLGLGVVIGGMLVVAFYWFFEEG